MNNIIQSILNFIINNLFDIINSIITIAAFIVSIVAIRYTSEYKYKQYIYKKKCDFAIVPSKEYSDKTGMLLKTELQNTIMPNIDKTLRFEIPTDNYYQNKVFLITVIDDSNLSDIISTLAITRYINFIYITKQGKKKIKKQKKGQN